MTAAGVWIYTLDNANGAVQALNAGGTLTDSFTVTTIDGTAKVVSITINGSNDAAIISGAATGSVVEAGGASPGMPIAIGTLTDTDVDNTLNTFTAVSSPTDSDGGYGTFTMTAAGVWTYTLDNNNGVVDALDVGDTLTDTFTVHTIDGTAEVVTIAIHGASDADPNDFDNLAVGTTVITDPPYVFGTPGSDSVAGGGDVVQIVYGGAGNDTLNGTGVHDTIYGGSGNDTIKGNGGDDTIYGGSGSDTINANNGNDTIIGGFGADLLTGGNGNDTFVYLSVPDSRAGQFDTITDFISGSDKIDLTAFGALGFVILALGSAGTSVPAHTIAWLYDSAANETIVYVNPTDHILSIGDSSLLEVHLQGIATIQSSDFVHETTTVMLASDAIDPAATTQNDAIIATSTATAVSSDTTVSGAPFVDANWTMQPTGASYFMDAARSQIDSTDDLASPRFDEVQTHSTEYTADPMAIAPRSGRSNELLHVAPIPNSFAFDQMPAANNADVMTIGHGAMMYGLAPENSDWIFPSKSDKANSDASLKNEDHGLSVAKKAGAMNEADTHAHASDTNSNGVGDAGGPKAPENGGGNHSISSEAGEHGNAPVNNEANTHSHAIDTSSDGVGKAGVPKTPENGGGNHSSSSEAGEHGPAAIHGEHDIGPSSIAHEVFGGPVSITGLEASFHFKDEISVPKTSGAIKVAELDQLPGAINYDENGLGTHGPVAISEAVQTTELSLPAQHSADPFDIVAHHVGGIVAPHVPHDLIV
jgi:VCBS repeat-containing protein